jgi:hypothetical protein
MVEGAFRGVGETIALLFILCCIFVPLGLWKLVEIIIWLFQHVSISIL